MGNPTSTHTVVHSRSLSTDRQKTQALGPAKVNTGAAKNQKPKQEATARRGRSPPDLTRQAPARKGQAPRPADASPVLAQLGLVVTTKDSHSFIHRCIHECSSDSLPFVPTTRLNKKHRVPLGRPGELSYASVHVARLCRLGDIRARRHELVDGHRGSAQDAQPRHGEGEPLDKP